MSKRKCGWFRHDWGLWVDVRAMSGSGYDSMTGNSCLVQYIIQERRCRSCNKLKSRRVHQ